ncbi:MAG: hypothetical protein ACLFPW_14320 [Spirochaetaceae bacterium]
MKKNVTLKLDEELLKLCRFEALEEDKSLSQWVADLLSEHVRSAEEFELARARAKRRIQEGYHLGGESLNRDAVHDRSNSIR